MTSEKQRCVISWDVLFCHGIFFIYHSKNWIPWKNWKVIEEIKDRTFPWKRSTSFLSSFLLLSVYKRTDTKLTWIEGTPSHGLLSVHSSHIMTPRLKISHFSVKGSFRMSSGAIHSGVPAEEESLMGPLVSTRESPKSQILTVKCLFTKQFALFKSRCAIFIRCIHIRPLNCQQKEVNSIIIHIKNHKHKQWNHMIMLKTMYP